jgi:hypothetical protein
MTVDLPGGRTLTGRDVATALLVLPGVGLVAFGGYLHVTIAAQVRAGQCDGCSPWHPLFVVGPLVAGLALVVFGGLVVYRR